MDCNNGVVPLIEWYSFRKRIPVKTKKRGITNLKEHYSFSMEQQTLVELLQDTQGQNPFFQSENTGRNGCILLLDITVDEQNVVLVNLYNANTEKDQLNTIDELSEMLKTVNNISAKQIILGGNFNLYFDSLVESQGGNSVLKKIYCQNDLS